MLDRLLEEAWLAATFGETEFSIPPLHDFNGLTAAEKDEIKSALQTLGFTPEPREVADRPGVMYTVFRW